MTGAISSKFLAKYGRWQDLKRPLECKFNAKCTHKGLERLIAI